MGAFPGREVLPWSRPEYDLDEPLTAERLLDRDRPSLVVHCAAWTDVDGCARDPYLAYRRNADAAGAVARACARRGASMVLISTNEVFDGSRTDGAGYVESDEPKPANPYGASKLAGEVQARIAFKPLVAAQARLWIIRTVWLYGPPGNDFPNKIIAAADRLAPDQALPVVDDEVGSPTYTLDLAGAIHALIARTDGGLFHLANAGSVSRHDWAAKVLQRCRSDRSTRRISSREFTRSSRVPRWAVLDAGLARQAGVSVRPWESALDDYLFAGC